LTYVKKTIYFLPEGVNDEKTRDILSKSQLFGGLSEDHITEIEKLQSTNITIEETLFFMMAKKAEAFIWL